MFRSWSRGIMQWCSGARIRICELHMQSEAESDNMEGDGITGEVGLYSVSYLLCNFSLGQ